MTVEENTLLERVGASRLTMFEVGYITGLIVGEGSFTEDGKQPHLAVKLQVTDPTPIQFLKEKLGGKVYQHNHGGRHYWLWLLRGRDLRASISLFDRWLPESRKRQQFSTWKEKHYEGR